MTNISLAILTALHEHKEIKGIKHLTEIINASSSRCVMTNAALLAKHGMIAMERPIKKGPHQAYTFRDRGVLEVKR